VTALVRCAVHELEGCDWCKPKTGRPTPVESDTEGPGPRFEAKFVSRCPECGDNIEPGDVARMVDGKANHPECCE
jgi:hypothetical protein